MIGIEQNLLTLIPIVSYYTWVEAEPSAGNKLTAPVFLAGLLADLMVDRRPSVCCESS